MLQPSSCGGREVTKPDGNVLISSVGGFFEEKSSNKLHQGHQAAAAVVKVNPYILLSKNTGTQNFCDPLAADFLKKKKSNKNQTRNTLVLRGLAAYSPAEPVWLMKTRQVRADERGRRCGTTTQQRVGGRSAVQAGDAIGLAGAHSPIPPMANAHLQGLI